MRIDLQDLQSEPLSMIDEEAILTLTPDSLYYMIKFCSNPMAKKLSTPSGPGWNVIDLGTNGIDSAPNLSLTSSSKRAI